MSAEPAICAAPDPNPVRASFAMPPGAVDGHAHVFGPREQYGYAQDRQVHAAARIPERLSAHARYRGIQPRRARSIRRAWRAQRCHRRRDDAVRRTLESRRSDRAGCDRCRTGAARSRGRAWFSRELVAKVGVQFEAARNWRNTFSASAGTFSSCSISRTSRTSIGWPPVFRRRSWSITWDGPTRFAASMRPVSGSSTRLQGGRTWSKCPRRIAPRASRFPIRTWRRSPMRWCARRRIASYSAPTGRMSCSSPRCRTTARSRTFSRSGFRMDQRGTGYS